MTERPVERATEYPRPPAIDREALHVRALAAGRVIAETNRPVVIRETYHAPVFYFPPEDVHMEYLVPSEHVTHCEFKGEAHYYSLELDGERRSNVAWYYPRPFPGYEELADHIAFYAWALDEATVDGVRVDPQPGHFYGGWITPWVEGPFKGAPGTMGW